MKTYREWMDWQMERMTTWGKLRYYAGNCPDWSHYYYQYILKGILKANSLKEAKKLAIIALGDSDHDDSTSTEKG